ncbi:MAG: hypothetical protein MHM6MM_000045 [Cercozoa sp. M6MM]
MSTESTRRREYYQQREREMAEQGPPRVLVGFLKKKSRREVAGRHVWQRRLWALDTESITCFKRNDPTMVGYQIPLWSVIAVKAFPDSKADGCRFDIVTGDMETWSLMAATKEMRDEWVAEIRSLSKKQASKMLDWYT